MGVAVAEEELPITYLPLVDLEIITLPEMELSRVNPDRVEGNVYFTAWLRVVVKMPIMLEGVDIVVGDRENLQPLPIVGIGKCMSSPKDFKIISIKIHLLLTLCLALYNIKGNILHREVLLTEVIISYFS